MENGFDFVTVSFFHIFIRYFYLAIFGVDYINFPHELCLKNAILPVFDTFLKRTENVDRISLSLKIVKRQNCIMYILIYSIKIDELNI